MQHPLTRRQMRRCIETLKEALTVFDRQYARNMTFFNDLSFYNHVRQCPVSCGKGRNVGDVLDVLEPYIPLTLTEENFDLFVNAVQAMENGEEDLPDLFTHKAKMDFVATLRQINDRAQWDQLFNVCEAIRSLKEDMLMMENPKNH